MFLINSNNQKILFIENFSFKLLKGDFKKLKKYIKLRYKPQNLTNVFINNINISSIIDNKKDLIIYDLIRKKRYIIHKNMVNKKGIKYIINIFYKIDFDKKLLLENFLFYGTLDYLNKKLLLENFLFYGTLDYLNKKLQTKFINTKKDLLKVGIFEVKKVKIGEFNISFGKFSYILGNYTAGFSIGNNTKGIDLDKNIAKNKMISEAVERISASLYNNSLFLSLNEINKNTIINPFQLDTKNLKYVPIKHFLSYKTYYIPANYIFYPYKTQFDAISNGMATHLTYKKAKENALLELIERDAYIISYLTKRGIFKVDVFNKNNNISLKILNLLQDLKRKKINYYTFTIKLDNKIPIIMFVLEKNKKTIFSLGSDFIFSNAVEKAILEGVSMISYLEKDYKQINYQELNLPYFLLNKFEKLKF